MMNTPNGGSEEFGNNFITVTNEDGQKIELEHLDTLEYNGETYMAFIPAEMSVEDEYELIILKVEADEETGDELLVTLEDEDLLHEVFEMFDQRLSDYYEELDELEAQKEGY